MSSKGSPLSPKKSIAFKVFACHNRGRLVEKYPFLTHQQIQSKLKVCWRRLVNEEKQERERERAIKQERKLAIGSPDKAVVKSNKRSPSTEASQVSDDFNPPDTILDLGLTPMDDVEMEKQEMKTKTQQPDNLTEDAVKDVLTFSLDIEKDPTPRNSQEETRVKQKEEVVDGLFVGKLEIKEKNSRLLVSEESEGASNFNSMFDEGCEEFM